jgi:hypothetical protein
MMCSDEDRGRSRRPGAEDRGWSHRLGTWWPDGREVRRRCVRSVPGTWRLEAWVSWLSLKTKVDVAAPEVPWAGLLGSCGQVEIQPAFCLSAL